MSESQFKSFLSAVISTIVVFIYYMVTGVLNSAHVITNIEIYIGSILVFVIFFELAEILLKKIKMSNVLDKIIGGVVVLGGVYGW